MEFLWFYMKYTTEKEKKLELEIHFAELKRNVENYLRYPKLSDDYMEKSLAGQIVIRAKKLADCADTQINKKS